MLGTVFEYYSVFAEVYSAYSSQKFTMLLEHCTFIVLVYFQNNSYLSMQRHFEELMDIPGQTN